MKKLLQKAIEWMMAMLRNTQGVYENDDDNPSMVKGERLKGRCLHPTNSPSVYSGSTAKQGGSSKRCAELAGMITRNGTETFNSHLSSVNCLAREKWPRCSVPPTSTSICTASTPG